MTQSRRKRCAKMTAVPAGAGVTPGSGADERRGCTPPACLHADKTWYGLPKGSSKYHPRAADRHLRTVPTFAETTAARTNAGQAGETAIARRSAKRKHKNTQRHPLTQGADADSAVHHPAADICRANSASARTYPKPKTRFALTNDIYSFAAPRWGSCAGGSAHQNFPNREKPLPLPEQPKTPAHEDLPPRGRAYFCVLCSSACAPSTATPSKMPAVFSSALRSVSFCTASMS